MYTGTQLSTSEPMLNIYNLPCATSVFTWKARNILDKSLCMEKKKRIIERILEALTRRVTERRQN